jgi:hypothetical protein
MITVFAKIFLWFVLGLLSIELVNEFVYALMPSAAHNFEISAFWTGPGPEKNI